MQKLPSNLYSPAVVARLDQIAIKDFGIPGYTLMRRAGQCVSDTLCKRYPDARNVLVLCGAGNNAGDGYVIARLAQQQGLKVKLVSLINTDELTGDARQACEHWCEVGEITKFDTALISDADVVIDALLGTGLTRDVSGEWFDCINAVNAARLIKAIAVIAVDVPSGLDAMTGVIRGAAIRADLTVSFIGLKAGLFTGSGKACCGDVVFDSLNIPEMIYDSVEVVVRLLNQSELCRLPLREHDSHKNKFGHVLIIGGNRGMPGAVILAARAALRSGAGLVSVITRSEHICAVAAACPEAMVHASVNGDLPEQFIEDGELYSKISCIAIGPGLGKDAWAQRLFYQTKKLGKPCVLDADALTLLSDNDTKLPFDHVITPHPGEAARLLQISTAEIQTDRFKAASTLQTRFGGTVVLKGSGTIVCDGNDLMVCPFGSAAMATAGMGDVLTGVIAAMVSQGLPVSQAASVGVCLHGIAGDLAATGIDRGLLASDVIEYLPDVGQDVELA